MDFINNANHNFSNHLDELMIAVKKYLDNRYDKFHKKFYKSVQKGFLKIASKNKRKYQIIDSNLNIKDNETKIINTLSKLI